jgi:hypothetical protein
MPSPKRQQHANNEETRDPGGGTETPEGTAGAVAGPENTGDRKPIHQEHQSRQDERKLGLGEAGLEEQEIHGHEGTVDRKLELRGRRDLGDEDDEKYGLELNGTKGERIPVRRGRCMVSSVGLTLPVWVGTGW